MLCATIILDIGISLPSAGGEWNFKMKFLASHVDLNSSVKKLSLFSLVLVTVLVLSTPLLEMSGTISEGYKAYRHYGYGILAAAQITLVALLPKQRSIRIYLNPIAIFVLWCCLSLLWTQHIDLTARRTLLLCLVYVSVFGSVCNLGYRSSLIILQSLLAVALFLNLAAVFAIPNVGTQPWPGSSDLWRGLMAHKNIAGMLSGVTLVIFGIGAGRMTPLLRYGIMAAALLLLVQSWSRTAMIALLPSVAVGVGVMLIGPRARHAIAAQRKALSIAASITTGFLVIVVLALTIERDLLVSLTDNASSVSLRSMIWRPMIQYYLDHAVFGSGYGAYWDASVRSESVEAYASQRWLINVDQGHNGYLDLLVQTGFPGLMFALVVVIWWPLHRLVALAQRDPERAAVILSIVTFIVVENFTESSLLADDTLGNFFLLFALAQIRRTEIGVAAYDRKSLKRSTSHFSGPELP